MAVNINNNRVNGLGGIDIDVDNATTFTQPTQDNQNTNNNFVFGKPFSGLMTSGSGSEYTLNIATKLSKIYKQNTYAKESKVNVFDKEVFTNLAYSSVVVSYVDNLVVYYYIILLEETGRRPMTAHSISNEYNTALRNNNHRAFIYTADDAINSVLRDIIEEHLAADYPDAQDYINVDGIVVTYNHPDIENIIPVISSIAFNACYLEAMMQRNVITDLNLADAVKHKNNNIIKFETPSILGISLNEIGNPYRTDWELDLVVTNNNPSSNRLLNSEDTRRRITKVSGFVEAIPCSVNLNQQQNQFNNNNQVIRLRPQIVMTSVAINNFPSLGYALLGLLSGLYMSDRNMYLGVLRPTTKNNNIGNLNIITAVDDGVGEPIDLNNKEYAPEDVLNLINTMFSVEPVISLDIESYGAQSHYLSILALGANPNAGQLRTVALDNIVKAANRLTNNTFPLDYNRNEIFAIDGTVIPMGRYSDKDGIRDIREFDLAMLCRHTNDMQILSKWAASASPNNITGIDSYMTRVDIISKFIPSAEITGKATRVTFHNKFLQTLASSVTSLGFIINCEPLVRFTNVSSMGNMGQHFGNAAFSQGLGFVSDTGIGNSTFNTSYSNLGLGRF